MIKFKARPSKNEFKEIESIISELVDVYSDFYITRNNLRLFIKENLDLFKECLQRGDKICYGDEEGVAFITGWSDNANRIYLKILAKDNNSANRLLKVISWNIKTDLFIKIKKNNPIKKTLERNGFRYKANRGKEILLERKQWASPPSKITKGEQKC